MWCNLKEDPTHSQKKGDKLRFIFTILTSQNKVQKLFNKNGQNEKACEVITENRMLFLPPHRFNEKFGNWDKLHHMVSNIRKKRRRPLKTKTFDWEGRDGCFGCIFGSDGSCRWKHRPLGNGKCFCNQKVSSDHIWPERLLVLLLFLTKDKHMRGTILKSMPKAQKP